MTTADERRAARPGWDRYYLNIAREAATRSNCIRRQVGALIIKQKSIISTGYNGTPRGVAIARGPAGSVGRARSLFPRPEPFAR